MKKRSSFGDRERKKLVTDKEFKVANIYTQQLSPKGSPIREETENRI
jgi:hypothetical protein